MSRIISIILAFMIAISLTGCAGTSMNGRMEPLDAAKYCAEQHPAPFMKDGHIYTTLSLTDICGFDEGRQLVLSYFSQYPDIDSDYGAVPVSLKYFFIPWKWGWRDNVSGILHSLHGGSLAKIDLFRSNIRKALEETLPDPSLDWQSGLILHAFADSYSHTKHAYNSDKEKAYNVWIGHAIPSLMGRSPDEIKSPANEPKYLGYIDDLYQTLKVDESGLEDFLEFKNFVDQLECESRCPNFHALYNQSSIESSRIDKFSECMNTTARPLTKDEVLEAINLIKPGVM